MDLDFINRSFDEAFEHIEFFFLAYVAALFVFWFQKKKDSRPVFVYPALFAFFTLCNPYFMLPLMDKINLAPRIRRIFWLLPVNLVLAFVIVTCIHRLSKRWQRLAAAFVFCAVIAFFGESQLSHMAPAENIYKIKDETIAVAEILDGHAPKGQPKSCAFADIQLLELRQYDPSIQNTIRRKDMADWPGSLDLSDPANVQKTLDEKNGRRILTMALYHGIPVEPAILGKYIQKFKIQYIILNNDKPLGTYFIESGCTEIGETEHYTVFAAPE